MISGTAGRVAQARVEREAERLKQIALAENRNDLMQAVSDFMTARYGEDAFYTNHPLVVSIRRSIAGNIIDLQELAEAVEAYQIPVEESNSEVTE